ncbi:MAG: hypothetical protein MUE52_19550 [Tabrizicola sp.]|jgi:hypothetical protein|nr:hypothetical protein [Tabrizicola sp.]
MKETVTYERMKGAIGSLLLLWATIETAARIETDRGGGQALTKNARGAGAVLAAWVRMIQSKVQDNSAAARLALNLHAQLLEPLEVRNGVCHGLDGISASWGDEPATITWRAKGKCEIRTWEELQVMFAFLSKIPRAIGLISDCALNQGTTVWDLPNAA